MTTLKNTIFIVFWALFHFSFVKDSCLAQCSRFWTPVKSSGRKLSLAARNTRSAWLVPVQLSLGNVPHYQWQKKFMSFYTFTCTYIYMYIYVYMVLFVWLPTLSCLECGPKAWALNRSLEDIVSGLVKDALLLQYQSQGYMHSLWPPSSRLIVGEGIAVVGPSSVLVLWVLRLFQLLKVTRYCCIWALKLVKVSFEVSEL